MSSYNSLIIAFTAFYITCKAQSNIPSLPNELSTIAQQVTQKNELEHSIAVLLAEWATNAQKKPILPIKKEPSTNNTTTNPKHKKERFQQPPKGLLKRYQCKYPKCSKSYRGLSGLHYHHKTHLKAQTYQCAICDQTFTQKYNLKVHKRVQHSDHRPYKCSKCSKRYPYLCRLKQHQKSCL